MHFIVQSSTSMYTKYQCMFSHLSFELYSAVYGVFEVPRTRLATWNIEMQYNFEIHFKNIL